MRAVQITELSGPDGLALVDVPEPDASHALTPGTGVVVDVHAAGVAFPELLQSRGAYQYKPPLPFVPGAEVGGIVRSAPPGAAVAPGDRVAALCLQGGFAEVAVAPEWGTFRVPDQLDFGQAASLIFNYHTAYFALVMRGRLRRNEVVVVHGAAGGVGTASLQIAKGLGVRTIAVVSTDEKERVARDAGAEDVVRSTGPWKDEVVDLGGADVVLDPVGGDRFTDSLRSLKEGGRLIVVGFAGGGIPEVKVNRLLLNNLEVVGAGWGAFAMSKPEVNRQIGAALNRLIADGSVSPIIGARFPLRDASLALRLLESRQAVGKVVLEV
jgi:NADPH2:quinone reductase